MNETVSAEKGLPKPGHETWGWDGSTGYRCRCGQMLTEDSWRNAEPLWRAHAASVMEPVQKVEKVGREWVGTCDHGHEVWTIHRGTEYNARRSLRAHATEHDTCPIPPD